MIPLLTLHILVWSSEAHLEGLAEGKGEGHQDGVKDGNLRSK